MPYLRIGLVVALAAGILAVGLAGPHPQPAPSSQPLPSEIAAVPTQPSTGFEGLRQVTPSPSQIRQSWLPGQITSSSMAAVGRSLFFVVDGDRIQSTEVGSVGPAQTLATAPRCRGINQLAAAGHELAYVVSSPGGPTTQVADCGDRGRVSWSVWLLDLRGGAPTQVAEGSRAATSIDTAEFPIHLALSESAYAFDRPSPAAVPPPGETVEVHGIGGGLLWRSATARPVANVMLGGGTLAVLTHVVDEPAGVLDLWTSDASHPTLSPVDQPARSASLSPDGLHLTWDVPPQVSGGTQNGSQGASPNVGPAPTRRPEVAIETVESGVELPLTTLTDLAIAAPLRPAVSSTPRGLLVTWFATAPGGGIYPAVRYAAGGSGLFLPSLQEPIWMSVQGDTLLWVAESADGWTKVAFAVDLASLELS